MPSETPHVVVLAGPNGAGKTTASARLLSDHAGLTEYVNADVIAKGLSAFNPENAAMAAGRIMLARLRELVDARQSFAFETTLASRSFAPRIREIGAAGYRFHLFFLHLASADLAIRRVATRVRMGGHHVPDDVVRRRYHGGLRNFFELYLPIAAHWHMYDNSELFDPALIARGENTRVTQIGLPSVWHELRKAYGAIQDA